MPDKNPRWDKFLQAHGVAVVRAKLRDCSPSPNAAVYADGTAEGTILRGYVEWWLERKQVQQAGRDRYIMIATLAFAALAYVVAGISSGSTP